MESKVSEMDENVTFVASTMETAVKKYEDICRIQNNAMDILAVRLLMLFLYMTVFCVAVSGNILVVYVVMHNKRMQTVTNIFICNLAISDLLVNFTSLWLTPMYTYVGHWIWGGWLCHGLPLFQGTSIFISTLTLMAIAVDRYFVIVKNSTTMNVNDRMSMKRCVCLVALIWLISLLLVMPYAVHMKTIFIHEPCNFWVCSEDWSMKRFKIVYGVIVMTLQFVVPFVIIGISYGKIWSFLGQHRMQRENPRETARKKRLLRMLVTMVVLFAVCWFPFNLLNIARDLKFDGWIRPHFAFVFLVVHLISMTATCWNPILYAWMNDAFRKEFLQAIPCLRPDPERTSSTKITLGESVRSGRNTSMHSESKSVRNKTPLIGTDRVVDNGTLWESFKKLFCSDKKGGDPNFSSKIETVVTEGASVTDTDESCHL